MTASDPPSQPTFEPPPDHHLPSLPALAAAALATGLPARLFAIARDEDLGPGGIPGDITADAAVEPHTLLTTSIRARQPCIIAGLAFLPQLLATIAPDATFDPAAADGTRAQPGTVLGFLRGPARAVLVGERPTLNLLSRLSGIATRTALFVHHTLGTRARICDTRKTTPGARVLEKYAVACGGGLAHRAGLYDAFLIKDNHAAARPPHEPFGAWVSRVAQRARAAHPDAAFIQVECDTLEQFADILALPPGLLDIALLDNMNPIQLACAVAMRDAARAPLALEASGGVTLHTIRDIAHTGVDRISVGSITHGATAIDLGLDAESTANAHPDPPLSQWADAIEAAIPHLHSLIERVVVIESTASTQDLARAMAAQRPGLVVIAGRQTAGRGRLGRAWHDHHGLGLALSITLDNHAHPPGTLALAAGLALVTAANSLLPAELIALRWPNDAVHRASGRKLAGVLLERDTRLVIAGFGINIAPHAHHWPAELAPHAISLRQLACGTHRLDAALALLTAFARWLHATDQQRTDEANRLNALASSTHTFRTPDGDIHGTVRQILPDGSLVIDTPDQPNPNQPTPGQPETRRTLDGATTSLLLGGNTPTAPASQHPKPPARTPKGRP